jgi:putative heme-binding domain-containing protein
VVRYPLRRAGSAFGPVKEIEFAAGAANDPYGFKPTDIVVQSDGTLMVSDWADGQRPKRGRGRIYHIAHTGAPSQPPKPGLDSESYTERWKAQSALERMGPDGLERLRGDLGKGRLGTRGRQHAVWVLARTGGAAAVEELFRLAKADPDPAVRAQSVRALADLTDPVLTRHKLDAGPGDTATATRLASLARGQEDRVLLEIVVALGRLRWMDTPEWLRQNLTKPDPALAHAAMQAMRFSANWPAILKLLDQADTEPTRAIALRALADRYEPTVVDGLVERLRTETEPARRRAYADTLTRVHRKPGPWVYWGYRPPLRPVNTVAWERTEAIAQALDRVLSDPDRTVRLAILRRMQREQVSVRLSALLSWLEDEHQADRAAAILDSLRGRPAGEIRGSLQAVLRDRKHTVANRQTALALFAQDLDAAAAGSLLELLPMLEDGPVLADLLRRIGKYPKRKPAAVLLGKLTSSEAEVRAAAIETLGELRAEEAREAVVQLLRDTDGRVRRAAAGAAGKLAARQAIESLLKLATDTDPAVRRACFDSLHLLRELRLVPLAVAALEDRQLELKALECLAELGGPEQASAVTELARRNPSAEVPAAAVRVLTAWRSRDGLSAAQRQELDQAVAEIHGANGILVRWDVRGPVPPEAAPALIERFAVPGQQGSSTDWHTRFATGTEARLPLAPKGAARDGVWFAFTDVAVREPTAVELLGSSGGGLRVWLNGKVLHQRPQARAFLIDSDRFAATLARGVNRLLVQVEPAGAAVELQLRFRRKSATAEHERLTQAALSRSGNRERGRKLFFDTEKSLCLKCHRLGDQGERIGPELTGVGGRFSRIHLVESILEPSRTIAPSFGTLVISLKNGKALTGVKVAETETTLTVADNQGQKHQLVKADIDTQQPSPLSTMPEGLEKRLTEEELVDLIAFLVSQKDSRP